MTPNNIYLGDCIKLMADIPDKSIHMILSDIPYGTTECDWDSLIPLGPLWAHYKRIIAPRGAIVLTASQPFTTTLIQSNINWFKYAYIWDKVLPVGHLVAKHRPMQQTEDIVIFGKGAVTYNPQMELRPVNRKFNKPIGTGNTIHLGHEQKTNYQKISTRRYPTNILRFSGAARNGLHPTEKPVALFSYLIRTYSQPDDIILDNAAGSGTTAISAIDTGRQWILIEKKKEYYEAARKRIKERLMQPHLPGWINTPDIKQLAFGDT